jgi:predicted nucleic acid-binding protein
MKSELAVANSLTLAGKEIPVTHCLLPHRELKFYPENPRIYSIISADDKAPSQAEIQRRLGTTDRVKQLVQSIKANGGLIDPLIVRDGDHVVLEGNSRLAAYRLLTKSNAIKWGKVKCCLLPSNIDESLVFALLGEYHIIGRKDWAPYEQAGYLYRRNKQHGVTLEDMAKEMGIGLGTVKSLIEVYAFMLEHHDTNIQRWSYYEEYLKSRKITKRRKEHDNFDKVFVSKVKSGEIPKAIDVREKVVKVADAGGKTLKKFLDRRKSLDDCYEIALSRGVGNTLYKHLNRFRIEIGDPDTKKELKKMPKPQLDRCRFELKKIKAGLDRLLADKVIRGN